MQKNMKDGEGDALDNLMTSMAAPAPPPKPAVPMVSHATYLKNLDNMPRLLRGNVFPGSVAGWPNPTTSRYSMQAWQLPREKIDRSHYHQPNEFAQLVEGAARMGLVLYAKPRE